MGKNKTKWQHVTKLWVLENFKQPECANCHGAGYVGNEVDNYVVCGCAQLAFRRQMAELTLQGKLREHVQRVGKRDIVQLEYREIPMESVK